MEIGTQVYRMLGLTDYSFLNRPQKAHLDFAVATVVKLTPKGYWIHSRFMSKPKIQYNDAKARWGYPSKAEAQQAFLFRKRRHIGYLQRDLDYAKEQLRLAELYENCEALDRLLPPPMA